MRDMVKISQSKKNGVELVFVTEKDLSYEGMLAKIPNGVPLKYVDQMDWVRSLESLCQEYAANVRRTMARQARRASNSNRTEGALCRPMY